MATNFCCANSAAISPDKRAAALVEFHRRRAPGGEGAGGLAAGEPESARHGFGIEFQQRADRGRGAEWAENARAVPAAGAEFRIIGADADPRRHFASGRERGEQRPAVEPIALGDGERRRHHFGRHMRHGLAVHVAHGDRGDEIGVEQGRAGERHVLTADHARFAGLGERGSQRRDLPGLLAKAAGDRAGERIEQQVLAVVAHPRRNVLVAQRRYELRQCLRCFRRHVGPPGLFRPEGSGKRARLATLPDHALKACRSQRVAPGREESNDAAEPPTARRTAPGIAGARRGEIRRGLVLREIRRDPRAGHRHPGRPPAAVAQGPRPRLDHRRIRHAAARHARNAPGARPPPASRAAAPSKSSG